MTATLHEKIAVFFQRHSALAALLERIGRDAAAYWLVGGCLRDLLLGREAADLDLVSDADPTDLARNWSNRVQGHWFRLDRERRQSRVIVGDLQVDFAPLRAESIIADLALRDFTVNALALRLDTGMTSAALLDPLAGQQDLAERRLRLCNPEAFLQDPLRMLKGIRHAVTLDFELSAPVLQTVEQCRSGLKSVAGERIRDEWFKIIRSKNPVHGFELMARTGLLEVLLGAPRKNFNWVAAVSQLQRCNIHIQSIRAWLDGQTAIKPPHDADPQLFLLIKLLELYQPDQLAGLLHETLRLSRREKRIIMQLAAEEKPFFKKFLACLPQVQKNRQRALAVELLAPYAVQKLLYWGVCDEVLAGHEAIDLSRNFLSQQRQGQIPGLLSGERIAALLYARSGPDVGFWQRKLKLAEINGDIASEAEAEEWLKKQISI